MEECAADYFALLGVTPEAGSADIRSAFGEKARVLIAAYQTLSDPELRAQHAAALVLKSRPSGAAPAKETSKSADEVLRDLVVTLDGREMLPGQRLNRRLLSRIPADRDIAVTIPGRGVHLGRLKDISGSGARIEVRTDLREGEIVEIGITPALTAFAVAQVARIARPGREYGLKWIRVLEEYLPRGWLSSKKL